ncbi:MAG: MmgE/PrpD family protein [Burkholderiales bacterium]
MNDLTAALARFASAPPFATVPSDAGAIVRTGFIDACATLIAGVPEPVVKIVGQYLGSRIGTRGEASVLFGTQRASAADAALINGTAAHALDYDDVALGGHPSTVLVPALLAEGEVLGASGAQVVQAYLVGYEVWAELIGRDADAHHIKGWHPTAVFGTVAAAAAVACLRRLNFEQARNAIGLAGSLAGGLVANFGTMTKPFHAGRAACAGIEAARLASLGMTAAADAMEHHAGFLSALSPQGRVERERPAHRLGLDLRIRETGLNIKKYPVCYAMHRVIDGVLDLVKSERLDATQVASVQASVGKTQAAMLRNHAPANALEAKFSLEFAVASSLVGQAVGRAQLTDEFVTRPEVQEAMKKVSTSTVDTVCPLEPFFALTDRVSIRLKNGREVDTGDIRFARGNAKLPLSESELRVKFMDCASERTDAQSLYERLAGLERVDNVRALAASHR